MPDALAAPSTILSMFCDHYDLLRVTILKGVKGLCMQYACLYILYLVPVASQTSLDVVFCLLWSYPIRVTSKAHIRGCDVLSQVFMRWLLACLLALVPAQETGRLTCLRGLLEKEAKASALMSN